MLPFILLILDGWGISSQKKGNAIKLAKTPCVDHFTINYPNALLEASGQYVGLPKKQPGNSEAGHMNIGGGRTILQDIERINQSINTEEFFKNTAFIQAIRQVKKNNSALHLMGLLSGKNSGHSYPLHLYSLLKLAQIHKLQKVYIHLFTDGRDSWHNEAIIFIKELEAKIAQYKTGKIAGLIGRFHAMDRNKGWKNTERAYQLLIEGKAEKTFKDPEKALNFYYQEGINDEFLPPIKIQHKEKTDMEEGDAIIFFNLRSDRARQLAKPFLQEKFIGFQRKKVLKDLCFVALTEFGPELFNILTAFPAPYYHKNLVEIINTKTNFEQVYMAESEKYPHITYFFNGGSANPIGSENRIMIPSPRTDNYAKTPLMRVDTLAILATDYIESSIYNFFVINFANPDMLGHTGNLKATIKGIEHVDKYTALLARVVLKRGGTILVTADHGNAEKMIDLETNQPFTSHTTNPVPFIIINNKLKKNIKLKPKGKLGDIAPTILELLKIDKPAEMKGESLIV